MSGCSYSYYLTSSESACPDIWLGAGPVSLGRGPRTAIKNSRVSRDHLTLSLEEEAGEERVKVTQRGPNSSVVDGKTLRVGESTYLTVGEYCSTVITHHKRLLPISQTGSHSFIQWI